MGCSSSDTDDEEEERLRSVAVDSVSVAGVAASFRIKKKEEKEEESDGQGLRPALKFYQTRAHDLLSDYVDRTFEIKSIANGGAGMAGGHTDEVTEDTGFYLFRRAPCGLSERHRIQERGTKTSKRKQFDIDLDEGSKEFRSSLQATAIEGMAVVRYAEKSKAKALSSWLLHQAGEDEAKRKEDERVALLKHQRGERWLPAIAKDMQTSASAQQMSCLTSDIASHSSSQSKASVGVGAVTVNGDNKSRKKKSRNKSKVQDTSLAIVTSNHVDKVLNGYVHDKSRMCTQSDTLKRDKGLQSCEHVSQKKRHLCVQGP